MEPCADITERDAELLARFPKRLSIAARARGFVSIFDLADATGVSRESIRKYRCGARLPTAPVLMRFSETLNVPIDWLLGHSASEIATMAVEASEISGMDRYGR